MKILLEISGGADSMLSSILAINKYKNAEFHGIIINYGQIPFENELDKVVKFCNKFNIELHVIDIKNLFRSGTVTGETYDEISKGQLSDIYTPLRNLVIGATAASLAETLGATVIVTGSKTLNMEQNNPWSFSDSTLGFYVLFNSLLNYLTEGKIKFDTILMNNRNSKMTKFEVFDKLIELNVEISDFWNCFNSNETRCNQCNNCIELNNYLNR